MKRIAMLLVLALLMLPLAAFADAKDTYAQAQDLLGQGKYTEAAKLFDSISTYEDASKLSMYAKACMLCESGMYELGLQSFELLGDFKDSPMRITYYTARGIEKLASADDWETMQVALDTYSLAPVFLDSFDRIISLTMRIEEVKSAQYNAAVAAGESGEYASACSSFKALKDYSDSKQRYTYYGIRADEAVLLATATPDALVAVAADYTAMGNYLDCADRAAILNAKANSIVADKYAKVAALINDGKCAEAESILATFGIYGNEQVTAYYYAVAEKYLVQREWDASSAAFKKARKYSDAANRINEPYYKQGEALLAEQDESGAITAFQKAGTYSDASDRWKAIYYARAERLMTECKWDEASAAFKSAGSYSDAASRINEPYYMQAEKLMEEGKWSEAVTAFGTAGFYKDALTRAYSIKRHQLHFAPFSASDYNHTVGLKSDGTVVAVGDNRDKQCNVTNWTDILAISAGSKHTVGLKSDGTVVVVGDNKYGQCNVTKWTNIVAISAGSYHTVGLKSDGTVMAVGDNKYGQRNVSNWTDIVAVSAGFGHTVGLKSNGTVVAVGDNDSGQCNVSNWTDIVAVSAGGWHTIGLKSDGTVVAVGSKSNNRCNVSNWTDIVAISAGESHTVGLKSDGTVVVVGYNYDGQCNITGWTDIVAISAGGSHTLGLKFDGTVVAVGSNEYGQCNVTSWNLGLFVPEISAYYYEAAEKYLAQGELDAASAAFKKAGTYSDANNCLKAIYYTQGDRLMSEGKWSEAIAAFTGAGNYSNSAAKIAACEIAVLDDKYDAAVALMNEGKYSDAYDAFVAINRHRDSAQKAKSIKAKANQEKLLKATVGSYITFGTYEQDNKTSNGKEDIEWLVLAKKNNRLLVISKYGLDHQKYNNDKWGFNVTWETCTLRKWLNNDFMKAAFSSAEQAMIPTVTVSADKNPDYNINPGNATQDKVFLLSITEAEKYFTSSITLKCEATAYAKKQGVRDSNPCSWWLRSPGKYGAATVVVGFVSELGDRYDATLNAVRPAMWIDLNRETTKGTTSVTVTAKDSVTLRNSNGSVKLSIPNGKTFVVTGYSEKYGLFEAEYNGVSGYVKGTGLNISKDKLLSYFK